MTISLHNRDPEHVSQLPGMLWLAFVGKISGNAIRGHRDSPEKHSLWNISAGSSFIKTSQALVKMQPNMVQFMECSAEIERYRLKKVRNKYLKLLSYISF